MIIDFHTHIFPDKLAKRAIEILEKQSASFTKAVFDGTLKGLENEMNKNQVDKSVVCPIATKPEQVKKSNEWSIEIKSDKILPLGTLYPGYETNEDELKKLADYGIKGIKIHPQYQNWNINSNEFYHIIELLIKYNFFALFHSGYDSAFPGDERACPEKFLIMKKKYPELKTVLAHFGGWNCWHRVYENLLNLENTYLDTSYTFDYIDMNVFFSIASNYTNEKIIFATDTPWLNQEKEINYIRKYFKEKELNKIFSENAINLLKSVNYNF